ncbi:ABC transporter ATP-binding protein [Alistipes sp.]|uniref:ABC transporter ATP-binding protein n=1 Tax=Alistipes sp. TaxID=1872444 RepID=UPI003AF1A1A8
MNDTLRIVPAAYRRRGLRVAATLLVRAALNLVGLAMLLPVLALTLDPRSLDGDGLLARVYDALGFASPRAFALAVCGAVVAVIVLKCLANLWLARIERRYIYDLYRTLSRRLFTAYHDRGLPFVKSANSAVLTRNVNVVCLAFAAGVLKPAAAIASEAMLLVLLFGALTLYAPLAAGMALMVFLPATWLYYRVVRNRIDRYGQDENRAQREKARIVAETFRGYADLELSGAFELMLRRFDRAMEEVIRTRSREAGIAQLPPVLTEIGLAAGIALLAALSFGAGEGRTQLLFGVFAVAALRLMPSVRSILAAWTTLRYNRYTIDILGDAAADTLAAAPDAATTATLPFEHQIAVRGLTFRFPDDGHVLFRDLDLTIRKGERLGIRGPSGSGKTTLFNLLTGLYEPTCGTILIDGTPLTPANRRAWQNRLGYVSQHLFLTDGTFAENVALGASHVDRKRIAEALDAARLGDFIASLPRGMDTRVGECGCRLSGGQRQRIGIARALYRRADVLFFDEATSALDSQTEEEINRAIGQLARRNPGLTLLVIAHRETSLAACDRIVTMGKE